MSEFERLVAEHRLLVRLIAVVMMGNLAWGAFSPFFIENIIEIPDELESAGYLVCALFWIIFLFVSLGALVLVSVRKSEAGATVGMLLGWPVSLTMPLILESNAYIALSSIAPFVLTILVIRMLRLAFLIEWKKPLEPQLDYPVTSVSEMHERNLLRPKIF